MTREQLIAVGVVLFALAVAFLASELDAWRLRRKAAKRQADFGDDHRGRHQLAGARQTFNESTHDRGRRHG